MKRLAYALVLVLLTGGVWSAVDNFRVKHPVSGREVTGPGPERPQRHAGERLENYPRRPAAGVRRHDPERANQP